MGADQQRWDPESYKRWAAYVPKLGRDLMGLLEPRPGERVLDLGCGDGTLTAHMATCGCSVLGVDRDAGFVKATRQRGLSALQADARHLVGPQLPAGSFDAVFSNAVLHWIPEAAAVIANVRRLLEAHGFQVTAIQLFPRPTPLPGPLSQWMDTFAAAFLDGLDQATRQAVVAQVSKGTASRLCSPDGVWTVDYVRLRFRAVKLG